MQRVIVGSLSPIKLEAVRIGFGPGFEVVGVDVKSDVPDQPFGIEIIEYGATNRCRRSAIADPTGDIFIGMESGLIHSGLATWFDSAAIAHCRRRGKIIIDHTDRLVIPDKYIDLVKMANCTVGQAVESCLGGDPKDPHTTLSNRSRLDRISEAVWTIKTQYYNDPTDGEERD
jgi:non-canonical (house-cleaning) NTP pyrophosphatase